MCAITISGSGTVSLVGIRKSEFGYLMLTPLVPVLLWAVLDREFLRKLWVETTLAAALEQTKLSEGLAGDVDRVKDGLNGR